QAPAETGEVGGEQSILLGAVEHVDVVVGGGQLIGTVTGAVGTVVVHDEHIHLRGGGAHPVNDQGEVLQFVVGGDDDQGGSGSPWCLFAHRGGPPCPHDADLVVKMNLGYLRRVVARAEAARCLPAPEEFPPRDDWPVF